VTLKNTSDSFGVPFTADFMLALTQTSEMRKIDVYKAIQLKSRYGDIGNRMVFLLRVSKQQMRISDYDQEFMPNSMVANIDTLQPKAYEEYSHGKTFLEDLLEGDVLG
jgi:hypothetical protein